MRLRLLAHLLALTAFTAPAFAAEPPTLPQRVDRIEKEMKAVQRKVFPGGSTYFEPEIAPQPAVEPAGTPASQPLNDLTARVDGIERALTQLTSQVEEAQHRLALLSDQSAKDRNEYDTRLKLLEAAATPAVAPAAAATLPPEAPIKPGKAKPGKLAPAEAPAPAAAADKAATKAAVPADTAKAGPGSGDPAEDAYMAGYRLWADKKYADAEAALEKVAKQYPKHKRASYARNLLGRAQLDEGKPATAAQTFLGNYQSDPHGERAAESLFYLGQSLTQLKKTDNACRAYDELQDVYGATMTDALKAKLPAARKAAACK